MKNKNKKYYLFEMKMLPLNILSFVLLIVMVEITSLIIKDFYNFTTSVLNSFILFIILNLLYMVIHKLLHSLAYCIYGGKFKKIIYGIELEKGIFYCLCKQNISRKTY